MAGVIGMGAVEQIKYVAAPVMLAGLGVLISIIGIFLVRTQEGANMTQLIRTLDRSVNISAVIIAAFSLPMLMMLDLSVHSAWSVWLAIIFGLVAGIAIGRVTEYYTSFEYTPTQGIAAQATTGPATVIIDGLAFGALEPGTLNGLQAPVVALVHHPLAHESGLPEAEAQRLAVMRERRTSSRALPKVSVPPPPDPGEEPGES